MSNPNFEYWLLLHFEEGNKITHSSDCLARLKKYFPGYNKGIDTRKINLDMIKEAIRRAKNRDNPPCADWPRTIGWTSVYRLVERLLAL